MLFKFLVYENMFSSIFSSKKIFCKKLAENLLGLGSVSGSDLDVFESPYLENFPHFGEKSFVFVIIALAISHSVIKKPKKPKTSLLILYSAKRNLYK
jgi:hypothetical protein